MTEKERKQQEKATEQLLSGLRTELFDPALAEHYKKAEEAAQSLFALYTELQRSGFTQREALVILTAMVGGKS